MPKSTTPSVENGMPNVWKEAYQALRDDEEGKEQLHKLNKKLRVQVNKPKLNLRSKEGYQQLFTLIEEKSQALSNGTKTSGKMTVICDNMLRIKDLVATGASVGGPYIAIPAAALFLAFSMEELYRSEKDAMFKLAERVAHYTVLTAKSQDRIKPVKSDDEDMRELRESFHMVVVGLYKMILLASAELANFWYGDWKIAKQLIGKYRWKDMLESLNEQFGWCVHYRDEMDSRQKNPTTALKRGLRQSMGPGPRNPLHWAVALGVPDRVSQLVSTREFPINALTPRSWTAAHLAAETGNIGIMKTLLTASGIDLKIKNEQGRTPLHIAALGNHVGIVRLLLQRDSKLLPIRDKHEQTVFLLAVYNGRTKMIDVLKQHGQDINERTMNGWTGLHVAAASGKVDTVKYLLANGAKKDAKITGGTCKGFTSKQIAERDGKLEVQPLL
ncbi:hypothetical protein NX059_002185 [Plenodomus lindquistii]|nr:hypothetical protein NX059_002185 [Plenodomus lindquistii]